MERKRGRWMVIKEGRTCYTRCSKCGFEMNNKYFFEPENFKYCPSCGRKMYPRRVYAKVGKTMSKPIPSTFDDFLKKQLKDEEFKAEYEKMKRLVEEIQKDIDKGKGLMDK